MVQIDRTNTALVGLDLYTVAEGHQPALIEAVVQRFNIFEPNSG